MAVATPPLAEGFVRLADVRPSKSEASDPYRELRPYVGKLIALEDLAFQEVPSKENGGKPTLQGTMTFTEYGKDDAEPVKSPIPAGAVRAIFAAAKRAGENTLVCEVKQLKRGISLQ